MNSSAPQAISLLQEVIDDPAQLSAPQILALAALCAKLLPALRQAQPDQLDPRFALALATHAEVLAAESLRTQIHAAHLVEASAAHCLAVEELDSLRDHAPELNQPPLLAEGRPIYKSPTLLLAQWLDVEHFTALGRIDDAHNLIAQFDYQHNQYPARFPQLAQRFADPSRHPHESLAAARRLQKLEPTEDEFAIPHTASALDASGELVEDQVTKALDAADMTTRKLGVNAVLKSAQEITTEMDPQSATGIFRQGTRHGVVSYTVRVTALEAETFEAMLTAADNPRTEAGAAARRETFDGPVGSFGQPIPPHPDFVTDEEAASSTMHDQPVLSVARRRLNALMNHLKLNTKRLQALLAASVGRTPSEVAADQLANAELISVPTLTPRVVVYLSLEELEGRAKTHGITAHGHELNATELRQLLAHSKIIPEVLGGQGEILDIGRAQRDYPEYMRIGITARDRGCIVPGCTAQEEHCEIHHIWWWSQGGVTAVHWAAMLCTRHHHDVHAGLLRTVPHGGVPHVILPKFVDPAQKPRRNQVNCTRIRRA